MYKCFYVLLFCIILTGCKPPMIVTRDDISTVAKCWNGSCENFFVLKATMIELGVGMELVLIANI